jgi:CRISPR-associated endonuclease/helicase Cas3
MTRPFQNFFQRATGDRDPYPYQERFAEADSLPHLLRAPTGAGKTATAVLGWLWRWVSKKPDTPRRLVYCLPMRVLVEQSAREATRWIETLKLEVPVHVLMGGVDTEEWYLCPEKPAVIIGTQDMLLSRALNRGYAASRFHWPIDFGLLNNDSLWVFDEPQLMGSGVSTSAQLAGLRATLGTFGACPSVWMSATLEPCWLDTVDFRGRFPAKALELGADQYGDDYDPKRPLHKRMTAEKTVRPLGVSSSKDMKDVARAVAEKHLSGTQTLVVLNTVDRAKAVYEAIRKDRRLPKNLLVVHSRFRPHERGMLNEQLQLGGESAADRIIVATQVIEAGVDISARTLVTELAPWASLVQRMGRCNRTGDDGPGRVFWIDLEEKQSLPYSPADLDFAQAQLKKLDGENVSPKALDEFKAREKIKLPFEHKHVLRRRDLLDLFDTTPDLSGNDIDIQRFVRGDDPESDVQVFWRDIPDSGPASDAPAPRRKELCSVPVGQACDFLKALVEKKRGVGYVWDHLEDEWEQLDPKRTRPGLTILLPAEVGGYDWNEESRSGKGWDPESTEGVTPLDGASIPEEGAASDPNSSRGGPPLTIGCHTENVCRELDALLEGVRGLISVWEDHLKKSARWHDVGKAHDAFQQGMRAANPSLNATQLWAKSGTKAPLRHGRKHFRHELASALAALQQGLPFAVAYFIAAHHGKVRLAIRALPGEPGEHELSDPDTPFALGVQHRDILPAVDLGENQTWSEGKLDLTPMRLGGERSWTAKALKLLADLGPFKLAYLEALLRAADLGASKKEADHA